jgi:hypothetical protein
MNTRSDYPSHLFKNRWELFCRWVNLQEQGNGKSSMWRRLISDFDLRQFPANPHEQLFRPNLFRGYNFYAEQHDSLRYQFKRIVLSFTYAVARAASYVRNRVWQINAYGLSVEQLTVHPAGVRWLKLLGLYDGFIDFCRQFQFSPHSAAGIKAYYVATRVLPYLQDVKQPRVIEIGGGFGNLAAIIHYKKPIFQYLIVDLPEMILHSSIALSTLYPEIPVYFLYPDSRDTYSPDLPGFFFCVPECVDKIASNSFDLGYNIDSFQEMTEPQVRGYLELMQRVLHEGAKLANLNRRKYLETESYDNNPLMYPYASNNKILVWETDLFMDRTLNYNRVRLDGWLMRIEKIHKI